MTDRDSRNAQADRRATGAGVGASRSSTRSRSRERDAIQSSRQLRSHTRANAALQVAYANNPRSISRLHDDELSCVLPFLELTDLAELVRCSRRLNGVARKERSRGLYVWGESLAVPISESSALSHHIARVRWGITCSF
jgi:hypothetical protein